MHPYHQQGIEWAQSLSSLSDGDLIARHNQSVGIRCFGHARQMYLRCLEEAVLTRDFDSRILFKRNDVGNVTTYRLSFRVHIAEPNGHPVLVAEPN